MAVPVRTRKNVNYEEAQQLGARMRDVRKVAHLSLREMAEKVNRPKSTLADAENGAVMPSRSLLEAYEKALDLEPGTLVTQSATMTTIVNVTSPQTFRQADYPEEKFLIPPGLDLINSHEDSRELIISLLIRAAHKPEEESRQIFLMTADPQDQEQLRERWFSALAMAIDAGCDITHIWLPSSNADEGELFINTQLGLITRAIRSEKKGKYYVYYLPETLFGTASHHELFISPSQPEGAVELYCRFQKAYTDSAIFYPTKTHAAYVQHFRSYFATLRVSAEPFFQTYPVHWSAEFDRIILVAEQRDGEELLIVSPASDKSMPQAVRLARMQRILEGAHDPRADDWLREEFAIIQDRRMRFEERVMRWPVRHILYQDAITHLIESHEFADSKADIFPEAAKLRPEEVRSCISQLISDLEKYQHYEIALITVPPPEGMQAYWEIVGDTGLFVAADAKGPVLHASVHHKKMLQQLKRVFLHQWENIAPEQKEKKYVIPQLIQLMAGI